MQSCGDLTSQCVYKSALASYRLDMAFRIAREPTTKIGTYFFHLRDGLHYHLSEARDTSAYFKCVSWETGCRGRAVFNARQGFHHTQRHSHDPDLFFPDEMALRVSCLERCRTLECTSYRKIIDQEGARYDDIPRSRVTLTRMRDPMRNARLDNFPQPMPASLQDVTHLLMNDHFSVITMTEDGRDNLYSGSVVAADGSHHVILSSERQLRFLSRSRTLYSDGTFKIFPSGLNTTQAAQVWVILTSWRSRIIPLVWVLMERRTKAAYTAVLQHIRGSIGGRFRCRKIISDFEKAQVAAWRENIPNPDIHQGCIVHCCRDMVRKAVACDLTWWLRNVPEVRAIVRLTCALPLLPPQLMRRGLRVIIRIAMHEGRQRYQILRPYLMYVYREWLSTRHKRQLLSVFRSNERTNNCCESQNFTLLGELGVHSNIYNFLDGLVRYEGTVRRDIRGLRDGRNVGRGKKKSALQNDTRLRNLWHDLLHPQGLRDDAIRNFLRNASRTLQNVFDFAAGDVLDD